MKPYYEQDGITIWHGDCREALPQLDDVALVITDPPYKSLDIDVVRGTTTRLVDGRNVRAGDRIGSGQWFPTWADDALVVFLGSLLGSLANRAALYVFGDVKTGLRVFPALAPANVLVWDKCSIGMGYSWRRMHEWVAYCPRPEHKLRSQALGDIIRARTDEDKPHPTAKPVAALRPIVRNSSDPGDMILDPFMGAGSTLVTAKSEHRRAIGIEIEERYCEIAARRLDQQVLQFRGPA